MNSATRIAWLESFRQLPPDLATGPLLYLPAAATRASTIKRISQIVKFGIPGTDMPGHEYLPDVQVVAIGEWVAELSGHR